MEIMPAEDGVRVCGFIHVSGRHQRMRNAGIPPGVFGHPPGLGGALFIQLLAGVSPKNDQSPHPKPTPQIPANQEEDACGTTVDLWIP